MASTEYRSARVVLRHYVGPPEAVPVIALEGELDILHLETVRTVVVGAARADGHALVVDLRDCTFVSLAVLALLERLGHQHGHRVRLITPENGLVRRVLHRVGMDVDFELYSDLADAVLT